MIRRPPRSTQSRSSTASDVYKRQHQDVPFEVVVERLSPSRLLTHHPLVQVMLDWRNLPAEASDQIVLALGDLQITQIPLDTRTARMDLAFSLNERWTQSG